MERFADLAEKFCSDIRSVVEIGALDGADARYLKSRFPNVPAFAIEGLQENYDKYMANATDDSVRYFNAVLSDTDGEVTFHVKKQNGIHGIFDRGSQYGTETRTVPCFKWATFRKLHDLPPAEMLKIDVEGATYEVLEGMEDEISSTKIMHIETESTAFFKGQKLDKKVSDWLESRGFVLLQKSPIQIGSDFQYDSVWARREILRI